MLEAQNHTTVIPFFVKGKKYKINFKPAQINQGAFTLEFKGKSVSEAMLNRFYQVVDWVVPNLSYDNFSLLFNHPDPLVRYVATSVYLISQNPLGNA